MRYGVETTADRGRRTASGELAGRGALAGTHDCSLASGWRAALTIAAPPRATLTIAREQSARSALPLTLRQAAAVMVFSLHVPLNAERRFGLQSSYDLSQ